MPAQVEQTARELIEQHGAKAVYIAVEAQNIDDDDRSAAISGRKSSKLFTNMNAAWRSKNSGSGATQRCDSFVRAEVSLTFKGTAARA